MNNEQHQHILALSGGVGGAKLAWGLAQELSPKALTVVVNTADDFEYMGLNISPDLDTLLYTLAGLNNRQQGWGLENESWQNQAMMERYGRDTWFQLGDQDLATHVVRTHLLRMGMSLSQVTAILARQLGIKTRLLPMSDQPVRTRVQTNEGNMAFQDYFVKYGCRPVVSGFEFDGAMLAAPHVDFINALNDASLAAVVICPSNPFVSVQPILSLNGVREAMAKSRAPVIAVSPIIGGEAVKGPAAKMMDELNLPATALAVAQYYGDLIDGFVIDEADRHQADAIRALGIKVLVTQTLMHQDAVKQQLAREILMFSATIQKGADDVDIVAA